MREGGGREELGVALFPGCVCSVRLCVSTSRVVKTSTLHAAIFQPRSSEHLHDLKSNHGSRRLYQMHQVFALHPQLLLLGKPIVSFYCRLRTFMFCPVCAVPPSPDVASDSVIRTLETDSLPFYCRPKEKNLSRCERFRRVRRDVSFSSPALRLWRI